MSTTSGASPIRIGIIGASGYTAQELAAILAVDAEVEVAFLQSSTGATCPFTGIAYTQMTDEEMVRTGIAAVFFATPHGVAMERAGYFLEQGIVVIDLSGDFRFREVKDFEKAYGMPHTHPELKAVYGLPEFYSDEIRQANLIANPGCYVTSALLVAVPLNGMYERVVSDAKSGYSGAGKGYKDLERLQRNTILPYNLTKHRHMPEIQQFCDAPVQFTPHILSTFRGITNTLHFQVKPEYRDTDFRKLLTERYAQCPLVEVVEGIPSIEQVAAKNSAMIGGFEMDGTGRLVVVSCLDNLRKGAASQAVQNLHVRFRLAEEIPEPARYLMG